MYEYTHDYQVNCYGMWVAVHVAGNRTVLSKCFPQTCWCCTEGWSVAWPVSHGSLLFAISTRTRLLQEMLLFLALHTEHPRFCPWCLNLEKVSGRRKRAFCVQAPEERQPVWLENPEPHGPKASLLEGTFTCSYICLHAWEKLKWAMVPRSVTTGV